MTSEGVFFRIGIAIGLTFVRICSLMMNDHGGKLKMWERMGLCYKCRYKPAIAGGDRKVLVTILR